MRNKNIKLLAACLLAVAIIFTTVKGTLAYFSDYENAAGKKPVHLYIETRIDESIDTNDNKHVTIANTGETPMIVRVRAFYKGDFVNYTDEEGKWTQLGDWWYYTEVLQAGESTSELFIEVIKEKAPEFNFDIVVIEESERVVYKDGKITPKAADWLFKDYKEAE